MKVSNPLTIIAIFAGVAEAFATGALVLLPTEIQSSFVYFVMAFPSFIVITFFFVLVFKPQVLYAPSDFDNEEHFLHVNNLKDVVTAETEKVLKEAKQNKQISGDLNKLSEKVAALTIKSLSNSSDEQVLKFMVANPSEAFTPSGIWHILPESGGKRSILESLGRLEQQGLLLSGMDDDIKVWQVKT